MVFNKKDFENLIIQLKPEGFDYSGSIGSVRFIKKDIDKIITIGIGYNQYFPHSAVIKGISVNIYFPEVENILEQHDLGEEYKSTFGRAFQDLQEVEYENPDSADL